MQAIKNIIFDLGNVLVKWSPQDVIKRTFPQEENLSHTADKIFKHDIWFQLNLGQITQEQAINLYCKNLGYQREHMEILFEQVKLIQEPIDGRGVRQTRNCRVID
jgi:putative hydrolase of the HAD superfamily